MQITWQRLHEDILGNEFDADTVEARISCLWGQRDTAGSGLSHDLGTAERFVRGLMPAAEIVMKWCPELRAWNVLVAVPHSRLAATNAHASAARALLQSAIEIMALRERDRGVACADHA